MDSRPGPPTRPSLLLRLRTDGSNTCWEEFHEIYSGTIHEWIRVRDRSAQPADIEDTVQEVLVKLLRAMKTFVYDPAKGTFRGWLSRVVTSVCRDVASERRKRREISTAPAPLVAPHHGDDGDGLTARRVLDASDFAEDDPLANTAAREDLEERLAREFDLELLEFAKARVQSRVEPKNWQAFELRTTGLSPDQVAEKLGMPRSQVDVAKCRIIKMIREEIDRLRDHELSGTRAD